jgi:CheY-like chemotaxis protein
MNEEFDINYVSNSLVQYLEQVLYPGNTIKLSLDIQLPSLLLGNFAAFGMTIIETGTFLGERLSNGVITIEIIKTTELTNNLSLHIDVRGSDPGYRSKATRLMPDIIKIQQEAEVLLKSLPLKTSFSVGTEYLQFSFETSFLHNPTGNQIAARPFSGKSVLLADDNELNAMVYASFLEEWGCEVTTVVNGIEAVAAARRAHYDLVLMDIHMPALCGNNAIRQIREFNTTVPIIALTASALQGDITASLIAGANDFLQKPVSNVQLNQFLKKYI